MVLGNVGLIPNLSIRESWKCDRMAVTKSKEMPSKKTRDYLSRLNNMTV